jgi:hypothetical protein
MEERADKLREEVAEMIASSTTAGSKLHLIDALERLCLDHLFEQEICAALAHRWRLLMSVTTILGQ